MPSPTRFIVVALAGSVAGPVAAQFGPAQGIASSGPSISDLAAADLDGDGDLDVVVTLNALPSIVWYENLGGGTFGPQKNLPPQPFSGRLVETFDYQADGDMDIVCALDFYQPSTGTDDQVVIIRNDGGGSFTSWFSIAGTLVQAIGTADFDGDGDHDLYYSRWTPGAIVFVPLEAGVISGSSVVSSGPSGARDATCADFTGDGLADVLVAEYSANKVRWFENLGGGALGTPVVLNPQADGALSVDCADLDGDGDLDALSSSTLGFDKELHWYRNLGGGAFGPPTLITNVGFPGPGVSTADLDGDGDVDVLALESVSASWYANDGAGNFGPRQEIFSVQGISSTLFAADLNDDGAPDVLEGGNVSTVGRADWFENRITGPLGTPYCTASANSTGTPGTLSATGSYFAGRNDLLLTASDLPPQKHGLFVASPNQGLVPGFAGGMGTLCVSQPIRRLKPLLSTGPAGEFSLQVDLATAVGTPVLPGDTWNFQAWHRDSGATTNLTDAVAIDFAP